ncbi:MAG: hypothetical protein HLUCCX10_06225 [Algoriphagus marincola HL-49]|uniref:Uncharacterized protein n=1 Tax=Algoriphagus marincola HL-49 TaxID=1305737 RepID=A0A0P8AH27_9BACT|nr:MAG: hypothetical protein HLUCCX10_06225 [Algoriphagus marincola HL-49]
MLKANINTVVINSLTFFMALLLIVPDNYQNYILLNYIVNYIFSLVIQILVHIRSRTNNCNYNKTETVYYRNPSNQHLIFREK